MISIMSMIDELGVREIMVVAHSHCGACHMSYDHFHHERLIRWCRRTSWFVGLLLIQRLAH